MSTLITQLRHLAQSAPHCARVACCLALASVAQGDLPPSDEILATSDRIAPRPRIGRFAPVGRGLDRDGRILLWAALDDGSIALMWASDDRIETLWRGGPEVTPETDIFAQSAFASPDGRYVLAAGGARTGDSVGGGYTTLFALRPAPRQPLLSAGDRTREGWTVSYFVEVVGVANSGAALVRAVGQPPEGGASAPLLLALPVGEAPFIVAGDSQQLPSERRFTSIHGYMSANGAVSFSGMGEDTGRFDDVDSGVYRADATAIIPVLTSNDTTESGAAIGHVDLTAVSPSGELLMRVCREPYDDVEQNCTFYRTHAAELLPVRAQDQAGPDGRATRVSVGFLNDAGEVSMRVFLVDRPADDDGDQPTGVVFYAADGTSRLVAAPAWGGPLNEHGQVAVLPMHNGSVTAVDRWRNGATRRLVTPDTQLDGARLLREGIEAQCLADDGRIGALVTFTDGDRAWLCADGDGVHFLDDLPTGTTYSPIDCAFAGDEMIVSGKSITRGDGEGVTPVVRPGDTLSNGVVVREIYSLAANDDGVLGAGIYTDGGSYVIRQRRGGEALEIVSAGLFDPFFGIGITNDGSLVGTARGSGKSVIVVSPEGQRREVARGVGVLARTAGDLVFVRASTRPSDPVHTFLLDLRNDSRREVVLPGAEGDAFVTDLARDGAMLAQTSAATISTRTYWRIDADGNATALLENADPFDPTLHLNSRGNLLIAGSDPSGGWRHSLRRSGPAPVARCPRAAATPPRGNGGGGGCQVVAPARGATWPLLAGAILAVIRARRARRSAALARAAAAVGAA